MKIVTQCRYFKVFAAALTLANLCQCASPAAPGDPLDVVADQTSFELPLCPVSGSVYGMEYRPEGDLAIDLTPGASLPITLGFQGFLFVQVGLRTTMPLPTGVKLQAKLLPKDGTAVTVNYVTVKSHTTSNGSETSDIALFFNDQPLAELVGKPATVQISVLTGNCALSANVDVILQAGNVMGADAAFWSDAGN